MRLTVLSKFRKDGKYKVKIFFDGAANMFGGRDMGRSYTKLRTPNEVIQLAKLADELFNIPPEIQQHLGDQNEETSIT